MRGMSYTSRNQDSRVVGHEKINFVWGGTLCLRVTPQCCVTCDGGPANDREEFRNLVATNPQTPARTKESRRNEARTRVKDSARGQ